MLKAEIFELEDVSVKEESLFEDEAEGTNSGDVFFKKKCFLENKDIPKSDNKNERSPKMIIDGIKMISASCETHEEEEKTDDGSINFIDIRVKKEANQIDSQVDDEDTVKVDDLNFIKCEVEKPAPQRWLNKNYKKKGNGSDNMVEKRFKCSFCAYTTMRKSHLEYHIKIHTGEKNYKCSECLYATIHNSSLRLHMRTHSGEKPFLCIHCDYATARSVNLQRHLQTHTSEKKPSPSDSTQAQSGTLDERFMRVLDGGNPFKCCDCEYMTPRKSRIQDHIRIHTGERPFNCSYCGYTASQKSQLRRHMRIHTT